MQKEIEPRGWRVSFHQADLTDYEDIDRLAAAALAEHRRVDVLVNNAGHSIRRSIEQSYDRFHDYERVMKLNYFGALRLTPRRFAASGLFERDAEKYQGAALMMVEPG